MAKSGYEEFQEQYEQQGDAEFRKLSKLPVEALLDRARSRQFGAQFQLWHAIASKATLEQAAWTLFDVLNSDADYLNRYHCANALIKIAGNKLAGLTAVMLSAGSADRLRENLQKVRATLEAAIGTRT